ncbi:hypothetical protein [Enterococcus mundtii]|uniref:hypothetical protein n=1 Tax=Enterococcus mundtii TaxID=53346 RepID=UPI0004516D28|nr:hypothetical protein [Enterococcus mundtii]EYT96295.1 hypothetical protein AK89_04070 [Enterococcus mundtii CRL35]
MSRRYDIESHLEELNKTERRLHEEINTIESEIDSLEDELEDLESDYWDIQKEIDGLKFELNNLSDEEDDEDYIDEKWLKQKESLFDDFELIKEE